MNQFEFLRNIPVGQYLPVESSIHRMDPRMKLTVITILIISFTFSTDTLGLLSGIGLLMAALRAAKIPMGYAFRSMKASLPFIFVLSVLQVFWNNGMDANPVLISGQLLTISVSDFLLGINLLLRFLGLIFSLSVLSYTTSTSQMTHGLVGLLRPLSRMGVQVDDFVMMVQVTLRFLPMLALTAERIAKAQAARGAEWNSQTKNLLNRIRRMIPLLIPLFLTSLHKAENLSLAMDARGYGFTQRSSLLDQGRLRGVDWAVLLIVLLLSFLMLFSPTRL